MKVKKTLWMTLAVIAVLFYVGCKTAVKTFVPGEPRWMSVELRQGITYDRAWGLVTDRLVKQFDLELLQKEDGYFRTSWLNTWTGEMNEHYRVRVIGKFSSDRKVLELKCEAEYGGSGGWVPGYDSRLWQTLQADIMGSIGNTTR